MLLNVFFCFKKVKVYEKKFRKLKICVFNLFSVSWFFSFLWRQKKRENIFKLKKSFLYTTDMVGTGLGKAPRATKACASALEGVPIPGA